MIDICNIIFPILYVKFRNNIFYAETKIKILGKQNRYNFDLIMEQYLNNLLEKEQFKLVQRD